MQEGGSEIPRLNNLARTLASLICFLHFPPSIQILPSQSTAFFARGRFLFGWIIDLVLVVYQLIFLRLHNNFPLWEVFCGHFELGGVVGNIMQLPQNLLL